MHGDHGRQVAADQALGHAAERLVRSHSSAFARIEHDQADRVAAREQRGEPIGLHADAVPVLILEEQVALVRRFVEATVAEEVDHVRLDPLDRLVEAGQGRVLEHLKIDPDLGTRERTRQRVAFTRDIERRKIGRTRNRHHDSQSVTDDIGVGRAGHGEVAHESGVEVEPEVRVGPGVVEEFPRHRREVGSLTDLQPNAHPVLAGDGAAHVERSPNIAAEHRVEQSDPKRLRRGRVRRTVAAQPRPRHPELQQEVLQLQRCEGHVEVDRRLARGGIQHPCTQATGRRGRLDQQVEVMCIGGRHGCPPTPRHESLTAPSDRGGRTPGGRASPEYGRIEEVVGSADDRPLVDAVGLELCGEFRRE